MLLTAKGRDDIIQLGGVHPIKARVDVEVLGTAVARDSVVGLETPELLDADGRRLDFQRPRDGSSARPRAELVTSPEQLCRGCVGR